MCGIVGIATGFSNGFSMKEADMFTQMLYMDAMRGWDSTGVFGVDRLGNVECHKEATDASDFLKAKEYTEFRSRLIQRGTFAVGHNRAATRGAVVDKNAHPFWVDDKVVLVQNGTYKGSHKELKDTEVDSEAIAHVLVEDEDIETALKKVNAAYALVWYDTRTKTLNLIRNDERPLWMAKTDNNALVWCSEPGFLYLAASRNNINLEDKPEMVPPERLVQLKLNGKNWDREDKELSCKFVFPVTQGYPFRQAQQWPYANFGDEDSGDDGFGPLGTPAPANNVVKLPNPQRGQAGRLHGKKSRVDQTLSEILLDKYSQYHMTRAEAAGKAAAIGLYHDRNVNKEYCIQLQEYEAANDDPDCSTWHVWGNIAERQHIFGEKAVVHWFIYDKSELDALAYVSKEWFTGKIASVRTHYYNDSTGVLTCFMSDVDVFDMIPNDTVAHAQTH